MAGDEVDLRGRPALPATASSPTEVLIRRVQRDDINAVDRAEALTHLRVALGLTSWEAVGELVGFTRQHLHNLLSVTRLPAAIREDVRAGEITEKQARALRRLHDAPQRQLELWERIRTQRLSGRAADLVARSMLRSGTGEGEGGAPPRPGHPAGGVPELITALMAAPEAELGAARPRLLHLQRWLDRLLERSC